MKPKRNFRGPPRGPSDKEFADKRDRFLKRSREAIREALKSRDMLIGTVTRSIEDIKYILTKLATPEEIGRLQENLKRRAEMGKDILKK